MSTTIETLFKITASVVGSNALKDLAKDVSNVSGAGKNMQRSLTQGAMALKAFAYSEAVLGLKRIVTGAIEVGAQLDELSQKTGVSVQTLGMLKGAGDQAGLGLDTIAGLAVKLQKTLVETADGTSKQALAFKTLGIEVRDASGRLKSADQIIFEMADKFAATADGAGKTAIATDLLGKSGADLIPVLNKGSEELRSLGLAVGPEFAARSAEFQDNMSKIRTQFDQLSIDVANQLLPGLISLSEGWESNNVAVKLLVGLIKTLETSFVGWQAIATTAVNGVATAFAVAKTNVTGLYDIMVAIKDLRFGDVQGIARNTDQAREAVLEEARRTQDADMARYKKTLDAIWNNPVGAPAAGGNPAAARSDKPGIDWAGSQATKAASEFEKAKKAADDWLAKQGEALITLQQEADYIGKTTVEVEKLKDARKFESEVAEKARDMTKAQAEAFKAQAKEILNARQQVIQYNYEQSRTFGAGAKEFFTQYSEAAKDSATQVKNALTNAFKGAEDALVQFTMTGKLNFKDFARSVIEDLVRIQIQRSITGPLSNILGSIIGGFSPGAGTTSSIANPNIAGTSYLLANGGIMTDGGLVPLKKYAAGGVARSPQVAIYGEGRMPEAYVPLPDGRTIPVTMKGGQASGDVSVTVNVNMQTGQETSTFNSQRAADFGRAVTAAVKAEILEQQRPGGMLAPA